MDIRPWKKPALNKPSPSIISGTVENTYMSRFIPWAMAQVFRFSSAAPAQPL